MLDPDNPIEDDIDRAAAAVARHCPLLDQPGLEFCFSRTFELPAACQLFDRFSDSYKTAFGALSAKTTQA
jgi:hypothetical protein